MYYKRRKCTFFPGLQILGPPSLLSLWLVLDQFSIRKRIKWSNGRVLHLVLDQFSIRKRIKWSNGRVLHLVWCSLRALMTLKSPKSVKNYSHKSLRFINHAKANAYFIDHEKSKISFPRTEKYRFTNHGKHKSLLTVYAKQNARSRVTKKV